MRHLRTRKQRITALAFSPDGRYLAAGGTPRVDVWDFGQAKSKPVVLPIHSTVAVLFTPAGLLVAVTDLVLQLYDPATATLHPPVAHGCGFPTGAVLSADGTALFTCWGVRSRRMDVSAKFPLRWLVTNIGPRNAALYGQSGCFVDATGRFVVPLIVPNIAAQERSWLRTHDPETGKVMGERTFGKRWTSSFRATRDGTTGAYLEAKRLYAGPLAGTTLPVVAEVPDLPARPHMIAFHPSGKWLVCGTASGVRVYDAATWREAQVLELGAGPLRVLAFDADGSRAAGGGPTGTVVVWDWDL